MSTIFDFAAALNSSVRPNQFRVHIVFPTAVEGSKVAAFNEVTFLTHQASLPSYNTEDCPVYYRGRIIHESGEKSYEQWSCTIYNTSDFTVRTVIENWASLMHDPSVVAGSVDPNVYKSNILIEQLDRNDQCLRVYKLVGAWPSSTGTIELDYSQGTTVESLQLQFYFDYFVVGGDELLKNVDYTVTPVG